MSNSQLIDSKFTRLPWPFQYQFKVVTGLKIPDLKDSTTWPVTPNLNLVQPPDGITGWGDPINQNWSILDTAASTQADWNATSGIAQILNKPTIPAAQVNSDWNAVSGVARILNQPTLALVATSGQYSDLFGKPTIPAAQINSDWNAVSGVAQILNKPTIPAAQVNSDWNAVSGVAQILNKPILATVAISGSYTDLINKPTIPAAQVNSDWNAVSGVAQILNKPVLAPSATTDTTNAANITSGVLALAQVPTIPAGTKISGLSIVATSGSYTDLLNQPVIPTVPTNVSAFTNDAGYITNSITSAFTITNTAPLVINVPSANAGIQMNRTGSSPGTVTIQVQSAGALQMTSGANISIYCNAQANNIDFRQFTGAATSGANFNSGSLRVIGSYWTGSAAADEIWAIQNKLGTGANPTSTLTFTHSGSTGVSVIQMPNISLSSATTATTATAGTNGAVPSQVVGYVQISINGTNFKLPYYAV